MVLHVGTWSDCVLETKATANSEATRQATNTARPELLHQRHVCVCVCEFLHLIMARQATSRDALVTALIYVPQGAA